MGVRNWLEPRLLDLSDACTCVCVGIVLGRSKIVLAFPSFRFGEGTQKEAVVTQVEPQRRKARNGKL